MRCRVPPSFRSLIKDGEIEPGRALDVGCGRDDNAIMLVINGCNVTGIDLVEEAIYDAKAKVKDLHVKVIFAVGNVLSMDQLFMESEFDTVIDLGLFHVMTNEEKPVLLTKYVNY